MVAVDGLSRVAFEGVVFVVVVVDAVVVVVAIDDDDDAVVDVDIAVFTGITLGDMRAIMRA